jgi:hypothetical protein
MGLFQASIEELLQARQATTRFEVIDIKQKVVGTL